VRGMDGEKCVVCKQMMGNSVSRVKVPNTEEYVPCHEKCKKLYDGLTKVNSENIRDIGKDKLDKVFDNLTDDELVVLFKELEVFKNRGSFGGGKVIELIHTLQKEIPLKWTIDDAMKEIYYAISKRWIKVKATESHQDIY
jgi:hypothetical protein